MAELILRAGQAGADDPERTGHKMARLAELGRAGLVVPESFVVTIEAYERHMAASGLGARVDELLDGQHELRAVAAEIGEAFAAVPVEAGVAAAIAAGYAELGGGGHAGYAGRAAGGVNCGWRCGPRRAGRIRRRPALPGCSRPTWACQARTG